MALTRVDSILAKYPDDEDPDKAPNVKDQRFESELARLNALENS